MGQVVSFTSDPRRRHRELLASFRFTHKDHARIRALAIKTREGDFSEVATATPLDAPYEVMAIAPPLRRYFSGQMIGMLEGCAILIWPKGGSQPGLPWV